MRTDRTLSTIAASSGAESEAERVPAPWNPQVRAPSRAGTSHPATPCVARAGLPPLAARG